MTEAQKTKKPKAEVSDILARPVAIIVSGPKAIGKSTAVAKAFPDADFYVTNPNVLAPYCDSVPGAKPRIALSLEQFDWGDETPSDVVTTLSDKLKNLKKLRDAGKGKSSAIVLDEFSTYVKWAWEIFRERGGGDVFGSQGKCESHLNWIAAAPAHIGRDLICVAHHGLPRYVDDDGGPNAGRLKHAGGPDFGMGRFTTAVCNSFDVVVQMTVDPNHLSTGDDVPPRVFLTQGSDDVTRGVRRWNFKPVEDETFLSRLRARLDAARK